MVSQRARLKAVKPGATAGKKPPPRQVPSDDLAIEQDGQIYYPHAGEWVAFRGKQSVGDYQQFLRLQRLGQERVNDPAAASEFADLLEEICGRVPQYVAAWNWTDDSGTPYPSPPTADVVRGLQMEELMYLFRRGAPAVASPETEAKND